VVTCEAPPARLSRGALSVLLPLLVLTVSPGVSARAKGPDVTPFQWLGTVPAGSSLRVENLWGDVRLRAGDPEAKLEVLASLQPGTPGGPLPEIRVVPEGATVVVRVAASPVRGTVPPRADLVLFVPGKTAVAVRTASGLIEAKGLRGDATLVTERGAIVAKGVHGSVCATSDSGPVTAELETAPGASQSLETRTGEVTAYLWEDAAVTADVATSGEMSTDFTLQVEYRRSEEPNKRAVAVLGAGTARLKVESKQGHVRLLRLPRRFQKEGPHETKPPTPEDDVD